MQQTPITIDDVESAARRIARNVRYTPLVPAFSLIEQTGADVRLKLESFQDTGAFKLRGATNKLLTLDEDQRRRGVVAVSSGNHGRGIAYAARQLGIRAVICMGSLVPENKVAAIRALGAEVRIIGDSQDEADVEAKKLIRDDGMVEAHPFDDREVIAGQGTIGLELLAEWPELDSVIVPLSGGGLIGGIALAIKARSPQTQVIGVTMERGAAMIEALKAGRPIFVAEERTLADALGGGIGLDNRFTFDLVKAHVDHTVTLSEDEIAAAMAKLYWSERLVTEGAGAVGVAALEKISAADLGRRVAIVISGRNVDMSAFTRIVADHRPD